MTTEKIADMFDRSRPLWRHPLSAAFPAMDAEAFAAMRESVQKTGVQNPIVLFEGKVIDGWHRYQAAMQTDTPCPAVNLDPAADPRDFVIAMNERRRHMTASQIAAAVAAVHQWTPAGANQHTKQAGQAPGATPQNTNSELADTGGWKPSFHPPKTNEELADIAGVSIQTIKQAKVVQTHAAPAIQAAVRDGAVSLKDAAAVAKRPHDEQEAIAAAGPVAIKQAAKAPKKAAPAPAEASHGGDDDFNPAEYEMDDLRNAAQALLDENNALKDRIAAGLMDGTTEERTAILATVTELREQVRNLEIEVRAITASRDRYMRDVADMKVQLARQRSQIAKLSKGVQ